jgi:LAS superfamily LD-carboxypeptidase LdcB
MALIQSSGIGPKARLSTKGPDVERWIDPLSSGTDFSSLLDYSDDTSYQNALKNFTDTLTSYTQSVQAQQRAAASPWAYTGGLTLPKLRLPKANEWLSMISSMQAANNAPTFEDTDNTAKANQTTYKGAGTVNAYGYKGTTGVSGTKGSAPYGLQPEFYSALQRAQAAMKADGLGGFGITDGWRSYEQQVATKAKKGSLAATPGRSIHGLGYAADLDLTKAQQQWLLKNGAKYGLYPAAGFNKEPWHWQLMATYANPPWR